MTPLADKNAIPSRRPSFRLDWSRHPESQICRLLVSWECLAALCEPCYDEILESEVDQWLIKSPYPSMLT